MMCFSSFFAIIWQKMRKNTSWKFTDDSSVTFQLSVSGTGEFGLRKIIQILQKFGVKLFEYKLIFASMAYS